MRRLLIVAVAVAIGIAGVAAVALIPGSASASNPHHRFTVVVNDSEGTIAPQDFFEGAPTLNAQATEDAPVYRDGEQVGLAETVFTTTRTDEDDIVWMIECSIELPDGAILFNGTAHLSDFETGGELPVVGGTGIYEGARGTVGFALVDGGSASELRFDFTTK
jgi:hypothetical protein